MLAREDVAAILTAAARACPGVTRVGLFGSYARGTQRPDSDVDVVVASDGCAEAFQSVVRSAFAARGIRKVDFLSAERLESLHPRTKRQILQDLCWVYEKREYDSTFSRLSMREALRTYSGRGA